MPEKRTVEKAKHDLQEGKSPSTAAGEFVREEIEHVRHGKHGVRSPQQAIAIGLSKARRAGIPLAPPAAGITKESARKRAQRDYQKGQSNPGTQSSSRRSRARDEVLKREPKSSVSHEKLSKQAQSAAHRRKQGAATKKRAPHSPLHHRKAA